MSPKQATRPPLGSLREAYRNEILADKTAAGQLDGIGYKESVNGDWYGNLSGATLADWFIYGAGGQALAKPRRSHRMNL